MAASERNVVDPGRQAEDAGVRAAELTGAGRGGVATIGVAGRRWRPIVGHCFASAAGADLLREGRIYYGRWHGGHPASPGESVVVTPLGDRGAEVHCHGGRAAVAAILADLAAAGAEVVPWQQWIAEQESASLLASEAQQVLAETVTARTAAIALDQVRGAMQNQVLRWIDALGRSAAWPDLRGEVESVLRWSDVGQHLAKPWNVVLAGAPNVGKSSLLNAVLGYRRAITFDAPGTTRDVLAAETVIDGWPLRISDTAGMRRSEERVEQHGVRSARRAAAEADLVLLVTDASRADDARRDDAAGPKLDGTRANGLNANAPDADACDVGRIGRRVIHVLNKVDLLGPAAPPLGASWSATVATEPRGIDALSQRIIAALVPQPPAPDTAVPVTRRQVDCLQRVVAAVSAEQASDELWALLQG